MEKWLCVSYTHSREDAEPRIHEAVMQMRRSNDFRVRHFEMILLQLRHIPSDQAIAEIIKHPMLDFERLSVPRVTSKKSLLALEFKNHEKN